RVRAWRVHDGDAGFGCGFQVDVVDADSGPSNHAELLGAAQDFSVHVDGRANDQRVGVTDRRSQPVLHLVGRDYGPAWLVLQELHSIGGHFLGDNNLHEGSSQPATAAVRSDST